MDALIASAGPMRHGKRKRSSDSPHQRIGKLGSSSSSSSSSSKPRGPGPQSHKTVDRGPNKESIDPSTLSILGTTRLPSSFQSTNLASGSYTSKGKGKSDQPQPLRPDPSVSRITDKKLRAKIARQDVASQRARLEATEVNDWINAPLSGGQGGIEVDTDLGERTWRVKQEEIVNSVGQSSAAKRFDLKMEGMGNYKVDYTRNGRHLAIASSKGHVATFDWQAGKLHSEIQLREAVRDIKFLQNESYYAVAQSKYVFIYDQNGVELHKLKQHIDPTHMEFLPYHYLLATVGHAGYLKYHDVSTGVMLTQIATHLGSPPSMAQNPHSAIIHLGHTNGTVTLWSPNLSTPHVKLLAHLGPVSGIAVDPSEHSSGRYWATSGLDGVVKLWDARMWGKQVKSWKVWNSPTSLEFSGRGMLAVGGKSGVTVYRDLHDSSSSNGSKPPSPYMTLPLPSLTAHSIRFCPFDDVLAVGHSRGISSLLVPGSGEANFDSSEADVYETHTRRREREVRAVLEKIRPELITLDTDYLGKVDEEGAKVKAGTTHAEREARSFRQLGRMERLREKGELLGDDGQDREGQGGVNGDDDDDDAREGGSEKGVREKKAKHKARGKGTAMKRFLAKKKKNVIDPALMAVRAKVEAQKKAEEMEAKVARGEVVKETGALARFGK